MSLDDRRAIAVERRQDIARAGVPNPGETPSDPYLASWLNGLGAAQSGPRLEIGYIVDTVPGGYAYRVSAGQRSFLWCSPGGTTAGFGPLGGRSLTTYPIGTTVYFIRHPQTPSIGTIIAAEPPWMMGAMEQWPADSVWPFIRSGQRIEASHRAPVFESADMASQGPVQLGGVDAADFSAGRPMDATGVGEWGVMMETGVGVFADPFQAYIRVDEATGIFCFYDDQLLRVAGHNYQFSTSHTELEAFEDQGELAGFSRTCIYPWEAYGLWRYNQVTPGWTNPVVINYGLAGGQGTMAIDPFKVQEGNGFAVREPELIEALSAARSLTWSGYLGQGGRAMLAAPIQLSIAYPTIPPSAKTATVGITGNTDNTYAAPGGRLTVQGDAGPAAQPYAVPINSRYGKDQPGVLEEQRTLAGGYYVRSATKIILAKRPSIPVPRAKRRAEDPAGDNLNNYSFSGLDANRNPVHFVKSDIVASPPAPPISPGQRAAMLPDIIAYAFNWEGLHPFFYHSNDWFVAEEGNAGGPIVNQQIPDYRTLNVEEYLAAPSPKFIEIDHRYGSTPIYENESEIAMLEDGSIIITDGWGSELRMGGGNIEFHCGGDIRFFPGRNFITWAGHDIDFKAFDSVDIVAENHDIRTAAGRNSHHLSGNTGCGGFLFEAKSVCPSYDYYPSTGEDVTGSGFVVLTPFSQVWMRGQDVVLQIEPTAEDGRIVLDAGLDNEIETISQKMVNRVAADGSIVHLFKGVSANEFTATYNLLGKNTFICGDVAVSPTGKLGKAASSTPCNRVTELSSDYDTQFDDTLFVPDGSDYTEFTHRSSAQYLSESFVYWRARWMAMAYEDGQGLPVWQEPIVVALRSGVITRPHPGERWTESGSFQEPVYSLVDTQFGWIAIGRTSGAAQYEVPIFDPPIQSQLSESYRIPFIEEDV